MEKPINVHCLPPLVATYGAGITFLAAGAIFLLANVIGFSSRELRRV